MMQEDCDRFGVEFPDDYDRKLHCTFVSDKNTLGLFLEFLAEVPDYVPIVLPPINPPNSTKACSSTSSSTCSTSV
jgi:hypothetical protein